MRPLTTVSDLIPCWFSQWSTCCAFMLAIRAIPEDTMYRRMGGAEEGGGGGGDDDDDEDDDNNKTMGQ